MKRILLSLFAAFLATMAHAAIPGQPIADAGLRARAGQFAEPLIPTTPTTAAEDAALAAAIAEANGGRDGNGLAILQRFADTHPSSGWRLAVLTNLGLGYTHSGYFSKAVDTFEAAWAVSRNVHTPSARGLVDRAAAEVMRIHARLGHAERVADLLREIGEQGLSGPATEMRDGARDSLYFMQHHPEEAYRCGPAALKILLRAAGVSAQHLAALDSAKVGDHGMSLDQVSHLAPLAHAAAQPVFRAAQAPIPLPSVVHWKVGHFAAIIGQQGDRYQVADPTFGPSPLWISRAAIDAETSGYFLVPANQKLGRGWRSVSSGEAAKIVGAGYTGTNLSSATTPSDKSSQPASPNCGMCVYSFKEMTVSLSLNDTPVGYAPPIGKPVRVTFSYNQREASQPATFSFFNVSPKWTLNWLTYIEDDPTMAGATVSRYVAGGGSVDYSGYTASSQSFAPDYHDASVLTFSGGAKPVYQRTLPDGTIETYSHSNGAVAYPRLIFLTQITDPAGNAVNLTYDNQNRLVSIKDAAGRLTTFTYGQSGEPLLLTQVTDPFGRSAHLTYDSSGRLSSITDVIGLTSSFSYDSSSLVDALTTAYGTTNFSYGDNGNTRYLQATDPLGYTERLEFNQGTSVATSDPAVPAGLINPVNSYFNYRDTFYWDKHAYAVAAGNYSQARIRHWAHYTPDTSMTSNTLENEKMPLENRVWYTYLGQSNSFVSGTFDKPIQAARILDSGATQLGQFSYNAQGNPTSVMDPVGRTTLLNYAPNGVDVTSVQQVVGSAPATIAAYTYNAQHLPLTYMDAAHQTYKYTYTPAGQILSATDPLGHTTQYNYSPTGDLIGIINADNKTAASFTYDAFDRVATRTDSEGWTVSYTYDALDRVTKETFPDRTSRVFAYKNLDLVSVTDRRGRTTSATYDAVRDLIAVSDPLGETTKFSYYENRTPKTLTDPNGNVTTWSVDLQSRTVAKTYANNLGSSTTYEATTSRVHAITDALGQSKIFAYGVDDTLAGVSYGNAVNPTPSVSFNYDPSFRRITSMTDGNGTTGYVYEPVGALGALKLASENPPFLNAAIAYQYDAMGRVVARSVGGDAETVSYDAIGRVVTHADDLGNFSLTYLGETSQLTKRSSGRVGTQWLYGSNLLDRRLTGIVNSPVASRYQYTTTPENDITAISEDAGYQIWNFAYDKADRLTAGTSSLGNNYGYAYDAASNLKTISTPAGSNSVTSNALNQVASLGTTAFKYDANGNLLTDYARTYRWDAENRLVGIGYPGASGQATQITYDGLGRRTSIIDMALGAATQTRYGWCGQRLCQARSATDAFLKRYLSEGETVLSTGSRIFYGVDQLGSIRDSLNASNGLRLAHFDYMPFGNNLSSVGLPSGQTDFKYAGLFQHQLSGLDLSGTRAYDPAIGRWLSRDPINELGGVNLYQYGRGNPLSFDDPSGLCPNALERALDALSSDPGLLFLVIATEIGGGGPEDPIADAVVAEEIAAAEETTTLYRVVGPDELSSRGGRLGRDTVSVCISGTSAG